MGLKKVFLLLSSFILLTGLQSIHAQNNPDPFTPSESSQSSQSASSLTDEIAIDELKGRLRQIEAMLLAQKDRENELLRDLNKMMITRREQAEGNQTDAQKELEAAEQRFIAESAALEIKIQSLEIALTAGRERDLQMGQQMNKTILITVSSVAGIGLFVFLVTVYLQYRLISRPVQPIYMQPPQPLAIEAGPAQLTTGENKHEIEPDTELVENSKVEDTNERFVSAIERLEARILHMEAGLSHADEVLTSATDAELEEMDDAEDVVEMSEDVNARNKTEEIIVEEDPVSIHVAVEEEPELFDELSKEADEMDVAVLEEEGKRFLQKEDWETAFQYYDQLVQLDNKRVDNWVNRGRALEMLKREEEAIESYDHAINTNPELPSPFLYKAALLSRLERFEEAQKFYNAALSKVPVQKSEKTSVV